MSVRLPEPFATALKKSRPREVCDADASSPEALFGRAMARLEVGRVEEARADFEAAKPWLGDASRLELAVVNMLATLSYEEALTTARDVLTRVTERSALRARALHVVGMACGKLRRMPDALDALFEASGIYRELGERAGRSQVLDTLGSLHASSGRTDLAIGSYAISLVEKTLEGDRYGMAITLGNLGRVHLQAGRFHDAIDCFDMDMRLAREIGDRRGCARMLNDLGRAWLGLEEHEKAYRELRASLEIALAEGLQDIQFFARKDLAMALIALGRLEEASSELEQAVTTLGEGHSPYLFALAEAARGELYLAQKDPRALELLEHAAQVFGEADLPDQEIPLRITLARAYIESKLDRMAEVCLERAAASVRKEGYERYRRPIHEAMARLGWSGSIAEERGRMPGRKRPKVEGQPRDGKSEEPAAEVGAAAEGTPEGYTILEKLGDGAFGEVFRAYDPLRDQVVALKRIYLGKVYDPQKRSELLTSAKLELEAASQLRHPGLARVFAIGYDDDGNLYVVQEFVKGRPLTQLMGGQPAVDPILVAKKMQLMANALQALHKLKIVHRDLKPENILLRAPDDSPVLVDFGIAYVPGFEGGFGLVGIGGTFPFIAPELFHHAPVSNKADMYSLGVVLYTWLAGRLPWNLVGKDWESALKERLSGEPCPITSIRPDLSLGLVQLVERLMHPDPSHRPAAAEVADICRSIVESETAWEQLGFSPASQFRGGRSLDTTAPVWDEPR